MTCGSAPAFWLAVRFTIIAGAPNALSEAPGALLAILLGAVSGPGVGKSPIRDSPQNQEVRNEKTTDRWVLRVVAGAGFEPATFRL